ncbi:MAG: hypothetical protein HAW59_06770, partial [Betaproteobacteria bacterium]|nr:hypothetical protein [Betaproteobacteria bacterium]
LAPLTGIPLAAADFPFMSWREGEVVITATADDLSGVSASQTFTITPILVSEIQIRSAAFVQDGSSLTLTAEVLPSTADNQNIIWSVENGNNSVASLNGNILTGIYPGEVTLIATAADSGGVFASQIFTVKETPVTAISISSANSVADGLILNLQARVEPAAATAQTVSWSILNGDNSIASIDENNIIYGISAGAVFLHASADGQTTRTIFTVVPILVESINITSAAAVFHHSSLTLTAEILPAYAINQAITWSVSVNGRNLASVDGNILTALAPGEFTLIAHATDGSNILGSQTFTVRPILPSSINISSENFVTHRASLTLTAEVLPISTSDKTVIWSVENGNNSVASLNGNILTGLSPGTLTLTASAGNITTSTIFTVVPILVESVNITSAAAVFHHASLTLSAEILPTTASDKTIIWSVENGNNSVASLNGNILTGISPGTLTIIATASGGENIAASQTLTVNPVLVRSISIGALRTVQNGSSLTLTASVTPATASNPAVSWEISSAGNFASPSRDFSDMRLVPKLCVDGYGGVSTVLTAPTALYIAEPCR